MNTDLCKVGNFAVHVFGEVLFDVMPGGVKIPGGAPFNVAWALRAFGTPVRMVSSIGQDADGNQILERMRGWQMSAAAIGQNPDYATGEVYLTLEDGEPMYEICQPRAWDHIRFPSGDEMRYLYHGSLALRSEANRAALREVVDNHQPWRFFDINLRPPHTPLDRVCDWMRGADWVKLNLDEFEAVTGVRIESLPDCNRELDRLRADYAVDNVLLTAGARGAAIRGSFGDAAVSPAPAVSNFKDAVGAGDAFTAVTIAGILESRSPREIIDRASRFAAKICGINGATTSDSTFYQL